MLASGLACDVYMPSMPSTLKEVIPAAPPSRRRFVMADEYLHRGLSMHAIDIQHALNVTTTVGSWASSIPAVHL